MKKKLAQGNLVPILSLIGLLNEEGRARINFETIVNFNYRIIDIGWQLLRKIADRLKFLTEKFKRFKIRALVVQKGYVLQ